MADVPGAQRLALVAVGGYGRGELHACSDVDILVLARARRRHQRACRTPSARFVTFLYDTGLDIGASVRSVRQCVDEGRRDVTIATTLIEARLLAGDAALFEQLGRRTGPGPDVADAQVLRRQAGRAAGPLRQVRRHRLQARTERQGKPRRPARHPHHRLGGQAPLRRPHPARAGRSRLSGAGRVPVAGRGPGVPVGGAKRPAPADRSQARSPAVRPAARAGASFRLPGQRRDPGRRAVHEALLPHGQGPVAAERDAAGALRGGNPARPAQRPRRAAEQPLPDSQGLHRGARRAGVPPLPVRAAGDLPAAAAAPPARARRARRHRAPDPPASVPDRRRVSGRHPLHQPVHGNHPPAARHRPRAAAHAPLRRAGALHPGLRARGGADAARPVSRLHGRRAQPVRAAQHAQLCLPGREDRRPGARLSGVPEHPETGAAVPGGAVSRHRQGPRRRSLGPGQSRRLRRSAACTGCPNSTAAW